MDLPPTISAAPPPAPADWGSWLGWTSCALFGVTVLFVLGCLFGTRAAKGWDKLGWVVIAAIGSWIGCGLGVLVALLALALREQDNRPALVGFALNLIAGGGPWLAFQIKKARGRRARSSM